MVDERQHRRHGGRDPHGRPREAKRRFAPGLGRRVLRFVPIAAVLLVLAWQVFAGMIADTAADSQPEEALAWRPVQPQALLALAGEEGLDPQAPVPPPEDIDKSWEERPAFEPPAGAAP